MTSTLDIYNYFTDNWAYSSSRLRPAGSIRHGLSSAGAVLRDLPERENSHSSSSSFNVYTWMCYLATCYRHYAHKKRREEKGSATTGWSSVCRAWNMNRIGRQRQQTMRLCFMTQFPPNEICCKRSKKEKEVSFLKKFINFITRPVGYWKGENSLILLAREEANHRCSSCI